MDIRPIWGEIELRGSRSQDGSQKLAGPSSHANYVMVCFHALIHGRILPRTDFIKRSEDALHI